MRRTLGGTLRWFSCSAVAARRMEAPAHVQGHRHFPCDRRAWWREPLGPEGHRDAFIARSRRPLARAETPPAYRYCSLYQAEGATIYDCAVFPQDPNQRGVGAENGFSATERSAAAKARFDSGKPLGVQRLRAR